MFENLWNRLRRSDSGEADHIAEEQEEIVTTLSREDSLVFAEVMKVIKGVYNAVSGDELLKECLKRSH